jgi:uncharacterized membrane protein
MKKDVLLNWIVGIAIAGMLFSGYLTYNEFHGVSCTATTIFGLPPCIYGFVMYLVVGVLASLALKK